MSQTSVRRRTQYELAPSIKSGTIKTGEWFRFISGAWKKHVDQIVSTSVQYSSVRVTLDQKNPGPPYLTGGPFTSVHSSILPVPVVGHGTWESNGTVNVGDGAFLRRYVGGFTEPDFGGWDFTSGQLKDFNFLLGSTIVLPLDSYYPQVKDRLRPKIRKADLAQFLIELKDAPRMLSKTAYDFKTIWLGLRRTAHRRNLKLPYMDDKILADSFLNHQFGWAPFIRDVQNMVDTYLNSKAYLDELTSRNGVWEHRSGILKKEDIDNEQVLVNSTAILVQPGSSPLFQSLLNTVDPGAFRAEILLRDSIKVWASGEWTFYRPEFDVDRQDYSSTIAEIKRYLTLYGVRIDPYILWKVMPWSWLVDWFFTVGPFINGLTAELFDNVASKNLFLMHSRRRRIVVRQTFNFWKGRRTFEFARTINVKQRNRAVTPFGFGLKWQDLSATQLSILAALGITRKQQAWL